MMPREHGVGGPEFSCLEQLLSEAAGWEPDAPAPEGLAARALAFELERQERERVLRGQERRAGLFATFFMGASAVSATVALAFFHMNPSVRNEAPAVGRSPLPTPSRIAITMLPGRTGTHASPGAPARTAPQPARRPRRIVGTAAPRLRVKKSAPEAPAAVWHEETVRREVAGVLSTGWLVQQDPEDGSLILTPGVLDLQTGEQAAACESPAIPTGEMSPATEPAASEPPAPPTPEIEDPAPPAAAPLPDVESAAPPAPES